MALQPRHRDQRGHVLHLPLYAALVLSASSTGDNAQTFLKESLRMFPMGMGSLLHGVSVPSERMVIPETPAAHPPIGMQSSLPSLSVVICETRGSPVATETLSLLRDSISR